MFTRKMLNCAVTVVLAMAGMQSAAIGSDRSAVAAASVSPDPKITYQGRLTNSGIALNALADFEYTIWSAEVGGTQLANVGIGGIPVDDGIFTAKLDFGAGAISGGEMWMEVKVCHPAGSCILEPLSPRQEITASPQAVRAIEGAGPQGVVEVSADTGNVGIGVADPVAKLEVDGDVKSSGAMTSSTALIVDTTTQLARAENGDLVLSEAAIAGLGSYVQLVGDGSSDVDIAICNRPGLGCHHIFDDDSDGNALKLESATELAINIQSPANEVMRITNSRVGIGTSVPSAILDLESSGSTTDLHINNTAADGDPTIRFQLSGTSLFSMGVDDSDGDKFKIGTGAPQTSTRLTIDGTGNVGIGTSAPSDRLHVVGSTHLQGTGIHGLYLTGNDTGNVEIAINNGGGNHFIFDDDSNNHALKIESSTGRDLVFGTNGPQERMRIKSNGNVGIGTTSPSAKTHINAGSSQALRIDNSGFALLGSTIIAENTNAGGIAAWLRNGSTDATLVLSNEGSGPTLKAFTPGGAGVALQVESKGCVGVGLAPACGNVITQTNARLHVRQNSSFPDGPSMYAALFEGGNNNVVARFDRQGSDGAIIYLAQAGIVEGSISVSGSTVSYNAFTGSHYGWIEGPVERGALMTMTGDNRVYHDREEGEVIYGVAPSTEANDSRCLGAYLGLQESSLPESSSNPHQIMAVGNGDMWVVDSGKPIQPGDYLISSDVAGHAMLDDPHRFPVGFVVARAAEPVDWSAVAEAVDGRKHKKISVFFESFERGNSGAVEGIVERQQQEIDKLRSRIESLESASSVGSIRAGLPYALIGLIGLAAFRRRRTGEDR